MHREALECSYIRGSAGTGSRSSLARKGGLPIVLPTHLHLVRPRPCTSHAAAAQPGWQQPRGGAPSATAAAAAARGTAAPAAVAAATAAAQGDCVPLRVAAAAHVHAFTPAGIPPAPAPTSLSPSSPRPCHHFPCRRAPAPPEMPVSRRRRWTLCVGQAVDITVAQNEGGANVQAG